MTRTILQPALLVALQHLHVVGPLEGGGLGHRLLAHAALHLSDGFVFMFCHPSLHIGKHLEAFVVVFCADTMQNAQSG